MGYRYTNKDAKRAFSRLMDAMGVPDSKRSDKKSCYRKRKNGKYESEVGCYALDTNHTYGGHNVVKMDNKGGGISQPLGMSRKNSREFVESVNFAIQVLGEKKKRRGRKK